MTLRFTQLFKQLSSLDSKIRNLSNFIRYGSIVSVKGLVLEVIGLKVPIGSQCFIEILSEDKYVYIKSEVISFFEEKTVLLSFSETHGIFPGAKVFSRLDINTNLAVKKIPLGDRILGRILDGNGAPLDGLPKIDSKNYTINNNAYVNPLHRKRITDVLDVGIRSINALLTIGKGQRIGLFSTPGLGKSILLEMIARHTQVDVFVIALIGERGREVKYFIDNVIKYNNLSKSVIIAAPASVSPFLKVQAASYATSVAEYFCKKNKHVLLIMDSLTRYAMAEREIAFSLGELPVFQGYPSSIFSKIANLLERIGNINKKQGSITAFYTVLMEEEDEQNPIAYIARSILDGHIFLSQYYASLGHYPAIDIESSVSRIMPDIIDTVQYERAVYFKKLVSVYQKNRDLLNVGAYVSGTDAVLDDAIKLLPKIEAFLQQDLSEKSSYSDSVKKLKEIFFSSV
jgi:flagellum-specific ATP synthase